MKNIKLLLKPTILALAVALIGSFALVKESKAQDAIEWIVIGASPSGHNVSGDVARYFNSIPEETYAQSFDFEVESNERESLILVATNDSCLRDAADTKNPSLELRSGANCNSSDGSYDAVVTLSNACGKGKSIVMYFSGDMTVDNNSINGLVMPVTFVDEGVYDLDDVIQVHFGDTSAVVCSVDGGDGISDIAIGRIPPTS